MNDVHFNTHIQLNRNNLKNKTTHIKVYEIIMGTG